MSFTALTYQGEIPTSDSLNRALLQLQSQIDTLTAGGGTGTVTNVSVVTANGMSGTVATSTTTPAITLVVGAINLATATGLPEAGLSLTNITTNNVSITKHGFAPILPNDATKYLDGTGAYTVPAGSGGITIGTTTITGGTTTRLLYDATGVVGEITGATSNGTALTLVAPVLGTPASGTLTNCTGLPAAGVVGTAAILGANTFTGIQTLPAGTAAAPTLMFGSATNTGVYGSAAAQLAFAASGTFTLRILQAETNTCSNGLFTWGDTVNAVGSTDTALRREAARMVGVTTGSGANYGDLKVRQLYPDFTNTATVGAVTINKSAGQCIMASGASTVVVTNSLVTANSQVLCTIAQNDTTATIKNVVATSGSFTITATAAATANCSINFLVLNQ